MLAHTRGRPAGTVEIARELRGQAEGLLQQSRHLHGCAPRIRHPGQRRLLELQAQDYAERAKALALLALRMVGRH